MRINMITEGVSIKTTQALTAYMITVAETYKAAPLHDPTAEKAWVALNRSTMDKLMKRLSGGKLSVTYSATDPYSQFTDDPRMMIKYMLYDMVVSHKLIIYSGDNQHPIFTEEQNLAFRAVHDFFAHGKIRTAFFEQLKAIAKRDGLTKLPPINQAKPLLEKIDMSQYGNRGFLFNGRGEMNAAAAHIRLAPKEAAPALFCEVVGQVSYQIISGSFGEQKVAILPGFDYNRIGVCKTGSTQAARVHELIGLIRNGAETLETSLGTLNTQQTIQRVATGVA
jgi:hypothetical protein